MLFSSNPPGILVIPSIDAAFFFLRLESATSSKNRGCAVLKGMSSLDVTGRYASLAGLVSSRFLMMMVLFRKSAWWTSAWSRTLLTMTLEIRLVGVFTVKNDHLFVFACTKKGKWLCTPRETLSCFLNSDIYGKIAAVGLTPEEEEALEKVNPKNEPASKKRKSGSDISPRRSFLLEDHTGKIEITLWGGLVSCFFVIVGS